MDRFPPGRADRVFITGASSGIGATLAREYAARGASLGLLALRLELRASSIKVVTIAPGYIDTP